MTPLDEIEAAPWWVHLALVILATARVVMLLYADRLTDRFRAWLWARRDPSTSYVGYLFTCPWCLSVWIGTAAVTSWLHAPRATLAVAVTATVVGVAAWVCVLVDDEE